MITLSSNSKCWVNEVIYHQCANFFTANQDKKISLLFKQNLNVNHNFAPYCKDNKQGLFSISLYYFYNYFHLSF